MLGRRMVYIGVGQFFVYLSTCYVSFNLNERKIIATMGVAPGLQLLVCMQFVPDTPSWLLLRCNDRITSFSVCLKIQSRASVNRSTLPRQLDYFLSTLLYFASMSVAYGGEVEATEIPAPTNPVRRINNALRSMNMAHVQTALFTTHLDAGVKVCDATKSDWNRFVNSEYQELISRAMMWRDGAIYIVELPGKIHEIMNRNLEVAIMAATGTFGVHLQPCGATFVDALQHIEPDESFAPARNIGAIRPANITWGEFHTLKIEVGVSRGWALLDPKAIHWATFPGVAYILCIRISPHFRACQYKLHSVEPPGGIVGLAPQFVAPIDINDATVVTMDSRRLLALPPHVPLPLGFANPNVQFQLQPVVLNTIASAQRNG
ncbi:hypothetical protein DYB37_012293 [Aphanomyces astaci]|uniref:Uncharacterized protein n=1 Tax=Aphanomyces astaci TaxID=112090 RepID=A0A418FFJ9_APHAT|nr:hypothetical protein DYB37_012293 [Aphanomyces astaci]